MGTGSLFLKICKTKLINKHRVKSGMTKAVLFDLDNTLIDFMRVKKSSVDAALNVMIASGVKISKKQAEKILYDIYAVHGIEHQQIFQKFLLKTIKKVDYKTLAKAIYAYRKTQAGVLAPYDSVFPTLIELKKRGLKLAIVTDAPRLKAWIRLVEMRIEDFFDVVVTHEDTGIYKPRKEPFLKALKQLKLKPEDCIMVGDWPERDIAGANKVGITTVFAKYGATKTIKNSGADYDIKDLKELLKIVK